MIAKPRFGGNSQLQKKITLFDIAQNSVRVGTRPDALYNFEHLRLGPIAEVIKDLLKGCLAATQLKELSFESLAMGLIAVAGVIDTADSARDARVAGRAGAVALCGIDVSRTATAECCA